jgi:DNA-binding transcriptional MerR regulator
MFTIGDFAKLGRVSVRMLRHYDAIGLLRPAAVDESSSYRFYHAEQLHRLYRIVVLKDLGFTLAEVQGILDDKITSDQLAAMLRLRRSQLEAQLSADRARLSAVESRLRMIEREGFMPTEDVVLKQVAPLRIAELSAVAGGYGPEEIGPAISPLYGQLMEHLCAVSVTPAGPAIAYYEPEAPETSDAVVVHAGMPVTVDPDENYRFRVVDLPAIAEAATIVHRGPMDDVMPSLAELADWIEDNGYRPLGYHREVYLDYDPNNTAEGVTELQIAVERA